MRRQGLGALTALIGSITLVFPFLSSASADTRVDGTHYSASGVEILQRNCALHESAPPDAAPVRRMTSSSPAPVAGRRSLGWDVQQSGYGIGPRVHVDAPASVTGLTMQVYPVQTAVQALAVVSYVPANGDGVWEGVSGPSTVTGPGWRTLDGSAYSYAWTRYDDAGTAVETAPDADLAHFLVGRGNGQGADLGFILGCNGNDFWVDSLTVDLGSTVKSLDFEGFAARTSLRKGAKEPRRLTVIAGKRINLGARLAARFDDSGFAGKVQVQRRDFGSKKYRTFMKGTTSKSGGKSFTIRPLKATTYRSTYAGGASYDPATSKALTVLVHTNVRARMVRKAVVQGSAFTVTGRFWPGRAATLWLQKYVDHEWTTVQRFRSAKDGTYRTSMRSARVGKSYWRVWNPPGAGNLSGRSPAMKLLTKPKPKPPHHGGGTTTPPPTNPDPPTNDPTQPNPPTGPL